MNLVAKEAHEVTLLLIIAKQPLNVQFIVKIGKSVYVLGSQFFSKLCQSRYTGVKRWYRKVHIIITIAKKYQDAAAITGKTHAQGPSSLCD